MKVEILFGVHPVIEAIRAGRRKVFKIVIADRASDRLESLIQLAQSAKIPVEKRPAPDLQAMTGTEAHQSVAARVGPYPVLNFVPPGQPADSPDEPPFFLLLDSILDPQNLGALIRTAVCAGVDDIILPKDRSATPSPVVSKASAGAMEHARITQATNLVRTMTALKEAGFWITGLDRGGERSIFQSDFRGPMALVVGGEEKGIRPLVKKHCDFLVAIPQTGPIDSLNASVAGAVAIYEAFRQRNIDKPDG